MHNHSKCEHKLEYCKICDVVYCNKCKEEWKKNIVWTGSSTTIGGMGGNGTGGLQYYGNNSSNPNVVLCSHNLLE